MPDTLSRNIYRALFSDDQWTLIYNFVGHGLDDDTFNPEDVYSIRNKIHSLFDYNDWHLFFHWWCCYLPWFGWCGFDGHHYCYCFSSILFFSYEEIKTSTRFNSTISSRCDSRTSGTHNLDETCIINYIRHIQNASRFMNTALVTPISRKAKNRFANLMGNSGQCIIEQHKGNKVLLTSENGENHFWVMLDKDPDWMVEL